MTKKKKRFLEWPSPLNHERSYTRAFPFATSWLNTHAAAAYKQNNISCVEFHSVRSQKACPKIWQSDTFFQKNSTDCRATFCPHSDHTTMAYKLSKQKTCTLNTNNQSNGIMFMPCLTLEGAKQVNVTWLQNQRFPSGRTHNTFGCPWSLTRVLADKSSLIVLKANGTNHCLVALTVKDFTWLT